MADPNAKQTEPEEPPRSVFLEPAWRLYREWTPDLIRAAEIQADGGNLTLAADLCETMFGDDRVKAVLDTRTDSLLGLPLNFEASGDGRRGPRAVKALEADEDWYEAFPISEQRMVHAWGVALGVGLAEIQWTDWDSKAKGSKSRTLPRICAKSPRNLRYDWNERTWKLRVVADASSNATEEIPIRPGDGKWIIYTPASESRPWVWGAYRALARWSLLKKFAIQDWGFLSERLGNGVWVVEGTGSGLSNDQRKMIAADLQAMGRNSALALPIGFSMKLIESVARNHESFKSQIDMADQGYAVSVLGQNLSTQATGAGNQAASLHGKVALGRTKFDDESLSICWRTQALVHWARFNFGDPDVAPWPKRDTTPTSDRKEQAAVRQMDAQADATLVGAGIMTPNEARARNGLDPIPGGDELVKKVAAPAPAAPTQTEPDGDESTDEKDKPADEPNQPPPATPDDDEEK